MLLPLQTEQHLRAIEASTVPHMKHEDAHRVIARHRKSLQAPEERKPRTASEQLLDGFRQAGFAIEEVPKPSR